VSGWTPAKRARQAERTKLWWSTPAGEKKREELRAQTRERWRQWAERYPERAQLVEDTRTQINLGQMIPMLCVEECGREGKAVYDWDRLEVIGWRCYECRRQGQSRDKKTTNRDEAQLDPS
jgi:hypothetical protein